MAANTKRQALKSVPAETVVDDGCVVSRDDHMGTARAIVRKWMTTDKMAHVITLGSADMGWNTKHYEPAHAGALSRTIWQCLNNCTTLTYDDKGKPLGNRPYNPNRLSVSNVLDAMLASNKEYDAVRAPSWLCHSAGLPSADEIFPMANGLLDVRQGRLMKHTPRYFNLWTSPVKFDEDAKCPTWEAFLESAHEGRPDCMALHQEIFGYYLISSTFAQKFAIIHGIPGTGKSVMLKTLAAIVGPGGFTQMRMEQFGSRDTHAMAQAEGKSILGVFDARIGPEMNNSAMMGALLQLPTGDGLPVRRNLLGGGDSHGMTYAKPIMASNKILRMPDPAIKSRMVLLCFNRVFRGTADEIPNLDALLRTELPGIVNWAIKGAQRLFNNGRFTRSEYSENVIGAFNERADPFGVFVENYLEVDPKGRAAISDMVDVFNRMHKKDQDLERVIKGPWLRDQLIEALGVSVLRWTRKTRYTSLKGVDMQGGVFDGIRIKDEAIKHMQNDKGYVLKKK